MEPLTLTPGFPQTANLLIALLIGIGFGFALEQAGFSSSRKLAGMFYGYDTTVIKVFFTAALTALIGSQVMGSLGLMDLSRVYINEFYITPAIAGGVIMGAGFIMGGFCPGTGISAASIGKIDAMVFIAGGLLGAGIFAETWPLIENIAQSGFRGPLTMDEVLGIPAELVTLLVAIIAALLFWLAEKAESRFARPEITDNL